MRNPKECHWAKETCGVYICRGMCLPCELVKPQWCDMEEEHNDFTENIMNNLKGNIKNLKED